MEDDIGGVKKMGAGNRRHSVAQVLLASTLMMLVATSHCMMSTTTTTAGNNTAASSAWCDGHTVDGQCIVIAQAYGGGEHLEQYLDLDMMDRMVVEYDDSGETSSRRVLGGGGKLDIHSVVRNRGPVCYGKGRQYTCLNKPNNGGCGKRNVYYRGCS